MKPLKDTEVALRKEQNHLQELIEGNEIEIETLKEEIDGNKQVETENSMLKRKIADLIANLEEEKNKLKVETKDLEKRVKD